MKRLNISDKAVKYILFQRTGYITYRNTFIVRVLRKLIPFLNYNRTIWLESKMRRSAIKQLYTDDIEKEYSSIREFLPENCSKILDVGCGVAGIDVFLNEHYLNNKVDFYLLDKTHIEEKVFYMFEGKGAFYNSLDVAREMLMDNEIRKDKIHLIEANDDNDIKITNEKMDLVISLISWGFHYPVETYLDKVSNLLSEEGIIIMDIRKNTNGIDVIKQKFSKFDIIFETPKYQKVSLCSSKLRMNSIS